MKFLPSPLSPLWIDLQQYRLEWLPTDLAAGLSVAAVQVPTAIAYAQLAGFSPEVGLYACILPVLVYAFLGSSKQLVVGPDAATCTMVASLVAPLAMGDPHRYLSLATGLSLAAGVLMLIGGTTGMGFIVNFFARPILVGFLNGIALSIIAGQMHKLLGIALNATDFIPTIIELFSRIQETHGTTVLIGGATLVMLAVLQRVAPRWPAALIALFCATIGLHFLGANDVAMVGNLPAGLPHLEIPHFGYHAGQGLLVSALGLVIVSFTSGMLTARSFAARSGKSIDANQEMWALGMANMAAGFSGSFAVTGADSRTAVNFASGNKTQLSSVFAALATGAVALWFSHPLSLLPTAALAAVLIFSAVHLMDITSYKELHRIDPFEFRLSLLTTAGVLTLGVLPGVAIAILLALIAILIKIYKPSDAILGSVPGLEGHNDISLSPESTTKPDVIIWRFDGPLVFFNADYFKKRLQEIIEHKQTAAYVILSMESITQIDATGIKTLEELHQELKKSNITLLAARPKTFMRRLHEDTQLSQSLSSEDVYPTIQAALNAIEARHSPNAGTDGSTAEAGSYGQFFKDKQSPAKDAEP
jgi:high affinity sulfate transporter 1